MKPASYMIESHLLRNEFRQEWDDVSYGFDVSVQPIDAPSIIAAGGTYQYTTKSNNFFDLPICVIRN